MMIKMTEHLKLVKENAYLKVGIITLIEAIDKEKQLNQIKDFLKDLVEGVEQNVRKENAEKIRKFFNEALGDDDCE
jgi:ribosomal protein L7/L12